MLRLLAPLAGLALRAAALEEGLSAVTAIHKPPLVEGRGALPPLLIFAMGPTGSGKSGQEEQLKRIFELRDGRLSRDPPRMMLVDEFIEQDAGYRSVVLEFLRAQLGDSPSTEQLAAWAAAAGEDVYEFFEHAYFGCRTAWGCGRNGTGGCEAAFEDTLARAYQGQHNVIYESTGKSRPGKKIHAADKLSGTNYTVVIGINAVDFCDLKSRNENRAVSLIRDFMARPNDPSVAAPRLPNLSDLGTKVQAILDTTEKVVDCMGELPSKACPGDTDELFIFSNEHWGFLPYVKVVEPANDSPEARRALVELKNQAKSMLKLMTPRDCDQPRAAALLV